MLYGKIASAADGAGAIFGRERSGIFDKAIHFAIALFAGQRKQMRIFGLAVREGQGSIDRGAERIFVDAIRGGTRGAAVDDGANRNIQAALGNVLMDSVVGEARQGFGGFVDVDFGFVGSSGLRKAQNRIR